MGAFRLTTSSRDWLALRRAALRAAATRCDAASREWNTANDELTDLAKRSGWDDEKTARVKAANRRLTDAYGATTFFQAEVMRLAADIQAEIAYWRALADAAADDPTGLRYDRGDDDEPTGVPAVPAHVDGLSITGRPPRRPTNHPRCHAGEADARLDAAGAGTTSASEAPNRVAARFGAGDSSPAGYASTERRTQLCQPVGAQRGGTALGDAVPPTNGGTR